MEKNKKQLDSTIDTMKALVKANGVAIVNASDSYVLMFSREKLQSILNNNNSDQILIMVQKQKDPEPGSLLN